MTPGSPLLSFFDPGEGRSRQRSSFGLDPDRGENWFHLRPAAARQKRVLLEPGETRVMADIEGSGVVTRLWMTTFVPFNRSALRDLVLRFYWDGQRNPSVVSPLGDFFGAPFGRYVPYSSDVLSLTSGGFLSLWPMPFATGARLEVQNEGARTIDPLFFQVSFRELDSPPGQELRFHAGWRRENPTETGRPYTVLQVNGQGLYVGCHLFMQNARWWLRPPLSSIAFPSGFGMGMLEGPEAIWIDDEQRPSLAGTGTEDHFNAGWYFLDGPFSSRHYGCTVRDYLRGRVAAYRLDLHAPVPFKRSIRVEFDHGFENSVAGDYASVAYWYQTLTDTPLEPLPPALARQPSSPAMNVAQTVLSLGAPLVVPLVLRRRWR